MKKTFFAIVLFKYICLNAQIITTVAGDGLPGYTIDGGAATSVSLIHPFGIATDISGNFYIADIDSPYVVHKVNSAGIISAFAGGGNTGLGDGGIATAAQLNEPSGIVFDALGNAYIADTYNNRIRKVNTAGIITTIAGDGSQGYSGDGGMGTLAQLNKPIAVATDASGNVYVADKSNNVIRVINNAGIISTFAGTYAGFSGDGGPATAAKLYFPSGVAVDNAGNVFIADQYNSHIRKVNTSGIITSIAGTLSGNGYSGDDGPADSAQVNFPAGLTVDANNNLYIADYFNYRIRKINSGGIITTVAGNGTGGFGRTEGVATVAELLFPTGVAVSPSGNLYIADFSNSRIREVTNVAAAGIEQLVNNKEQVNIYPNPTSGQFFIEANTTDKLNVDLYDINGRHVFSASLMDKSKINVATLDNGAYTLTIKTTDRVINKKLVILR